MLSPVSAAQVTGDLEGPETWRVMQVFDICI